MAGLAAAITAANQGLHVVLAEKAEKFGGITARSGGWLWIPNSSLARNQSVQDDPDAVRTYISSECGERFDRGKLDVYLARAPEALDYFLKNTALELDLAPAYPDYHAEAVGASLGGRAMSTRPFSGLELGKDIERLAPPLPELMVFGMMLGSGKEIWHFLRAFKSFESFCVVVGRLASTAADVVRYGRSMRLTNGNALVARLLKSARDKNVALWHSAPLHRLVVEDARVVGAVVEREGVATTVRARRGVVLACGGFSHDIERRKALFVHAPTGREHFSPTSNTNTGDGQRMAVAVGAKFDADLAQPAAWVPTSVVRRKDGSTGIMPHFIDRAKPGVIAVSPKGRRFVNEANSYHDFVQAMISECRGEPETYAWLVGDHLALRTYGLGCAAAFPMPLSPHLKSGYLKRGRTLAELAQAIGVDRTVLQSEVARFNADAKVGSDTAFGKGSAIYNRFMGDPRHRPNPCLRALTKPPFYAVKLLPGDVGTFAGLETNEHGQVLDEAGAAIPGLYSAGNDAASIFRGTYPGPGITLGPALTFGYLAGLHLSGRNN